MKNAHNLPVNKKCCSKLPAMISWNWGKVLYCIFPIYGAVCIYIFFGILLPFPHLGSSGDITHGEVTHMTPAVGFIGIADLKEILVLIAAASSNSLYLSRPLKIQHWIKVCGFVLLTTNSCCGKKIIAL